MIKFKSAPRLKESFGVSGMLEETCSVFYETLFDVTHVGRVADLMVARLKPSGLDETRFRVILTLSLYQAYRGQTDGKTSQKDKLPEPVVIEVGIDEEKIAIAVTYSLNPGQEIKIEQWKSRLQSMENLTWFEISMGRLLVHSDQILVKAQPTTRKVELLSLMLLSDKKTNFIADVKGGVDFVELGPVVEQAPKAASMEELGDLNYGELLKDKSPQSKHTVSPNVESIVVKGEQKDEDTLSRSIRGRDQKNENHSVTVKGEPLPEDKTETVFENDAKVAEHKTLVKGTKAQRDNSTTRVGGTEESDSNEMITVKGGTLPRENSSELTSAQVKLHQDQLSQLQSRIAELESELDQKKSMTVGSGAQESSAPKNGLFGFMKRLFTGEEENTEVLTEPSSSSGPLPLDTTEKTLEPDKGLEEDKKETGNEKIEDANQVIKNLMLTIEAGSLDGTIKRIQKESVSLQSEMKSQRGKKWVDGLVGDLIAEKAKIKDMTKKLTTSLRQKELEFKNKERAFLDELRRRDETMITKDKSMIRLKDQLSQANMSLERMRSSSKSAAQESHYEKKYNYTRNLLSQIKEENAALKKRIDETLNMSQPAHERQGPSEAELTAQTEIERNKKQIEEARKQNSHLMEKIIDAEKRHTALASRADEFRKRLDQAMALMNTKKDEAESLKKKMTELEAEKIRLARKLNEYQTKGVLDSEAAPGNDKEEGKKAAQGGSSKPPASDAA